MLTCKRSSFSLPDRGTYLNCGYMSPLLKSVEKVGIRALRRKRNPASISAEDFFTDTESLRKEFARLVNVADPSRNVVIPSVSYGMANVAKNMNITRGQKIIVAAEQFPSNYYPWQALCADTGATIHVVSPPDTLEGRGKKWNEKILDAIDNTTRAVALGNIHWVDGTLFDLAAIRKRTREVGALLIVDGTQSIGALPFDVSTIQPDALVCGGYKWLLGPYSIGMAYYGDYFTDGKPIEESWMNRAHSEVFSQLTNYQTDYQPGALRYEVGEHSNFIMVPMLHKSIEQLNRWGVANVQEYCAAITKTPIATLRENGFWIEADDARSAHLFGIRPQGRDMQAIKARLQKNNIHVSYRADAIRVTPNVYNRDRDIQKLVKVLLS